MALTATQPRQVRLIKCAILSPGLERLATGEAAGVLKNYGFDIIPYVQKIDIYESIFSNTLSGSITLLEDVGFIEYLPLVGVETLAVVFSVDTPSGFEYTFQRTFRIVKVGNVTYPRQEWRLYTLKLATNEFVQSASTRICKAYTDTASRNVRSIMTDLRIPSEQINVFDETTEKLQVTIPNYTPLQAINFFTLLAQTGDTKESNFLFFETMFSKLSVGTQPGGVGLGGFHFTSIKQLITTGLDIGLNNLHTFAADPARTTALRLTDDDSRDAIIRVHQEQAFDLLYDIAGGLLHSQVVKFDYLARVVDKLDNIPTVESRYDDTFDSRTHLSKYPVYPENFDLSADQTVRTFTIPSAEASASSAFAKQKGVNDIAVQKLYESIVLRARQMREIQHIKTIIDLPGQPDLRAGSVVNVLYPSSRSLENVNGTYNDPAFSAGTPYHSGPHLVTSVHHILAVRGSNTMEYRMHIRVNRDSFSAPLLGFSE